MLEKVRALQKVFKENQNLRKELVFYKAYANTMKEKSDFMEETLREILHYKLENPEATTYDLNQVGRKFVANKKQNKNSNHQINVNNERRASEKCFDFKPKTIDYASRFLMDEPIEVEGYPYSEDSLIKESC